jgi:uncharacterized protein (DUF1501 family)
MLKLNRSRDLFPLGENPLPAPRPAMDPTSTRRGFLRQLVFSQRATVESTGATTLVCIFLRGGADTLNMLVPCGDDDYYRNRPTLSIARPGKAKDSAIRLDDFYGFHPKMAPLESIYKDGRLGIAQAVGSDNPTGSHFEAQDQIEHGESYGNNLGGGWLGRHLRSRATSNDSPLAGIAIGASMPESLRGAPGASALRSLDDMQLPIASGNPEAISRALSKMYEAEVGIIGRQGKETLNLLHRVEQLRGKPYAPAAGAQYPNDEFGAGLREIARIVKANLGLEVACIDLGGWDTHFFQGTSNGLQAGNIDSLSQGLAAFDADLKGYRDRVTTIAMTEFGRRLYENGSAGTDHGRGFAFFAMGEKINGGKIHGQWPGLKEEPSLPGPGGMEVTIDYRSALSEILVGGIGNVKIDEVFPGFQPQPVGICDAKQGAHSA